MKQQNNATLYYV